MNQKRTVYIGFDPRETDAFAVARSSIIDHQTRPIQIRGLILDDLRKKGLYYRRHTRKDGVLWDLISDAPMSTEFACSRFLTPIVAGEGLALFIDADMLIRSNIHDLFDLYDYRKAVMVVKHRYDPPAGTKMDGQVQTRYARKNWSSVVLFNADHPANRALTVELINTVPGRDLHRFCWLPDDLIGELDASWNWLPGHSDPEIDPDIVHFTNGIPSMPGYEKEPYADEWREALHRWAR